MALRLSCPDRPQFHGEIREIPGLVNRDAARALESAPQVAAAIELEVRKARVIRNLSRSYSHGLQSDAWQLQVHQVANLLHRPDLQLRRETTSQLLRRH